MYYAFCMDLRTNTDLCLLQPEVIVSCNRDEGVYCAVRTGFLNKTDYDFSLKCSRDYMLGVVLRMLGVDGLEIMKHVIISIRKVESGPRISVMLE